MRTTVAKALAGAAVAALASGGFHVPRAIAQQPPAAGGQQSGDLAQKLSNPISDLVSVPFQFNWQQGAGPLKQTQFILNVQPVIPFTLTSKVNLITRIIAPILGQPQQSRGEAPAFGLGDLTTSFFFSPSGTSGYTWGVGPVFVLPSSNDPRLGSGKWSAGPTIIALIQPGAWTIGVLWNQVWSFAGDSDRRSVSQMFLQPFAAYQATKTLTLTLQSETTADWTAEDDDDTWTVPINLQVSKLATFGPLPASYLIGFGAFADQPALGPEWKIRAAIVLLLPRREG